MNETNWVPGLVVLGLALVGGALAALMGRSKSRAPKRGKSSTDEPGIHSDELTDVEDGIEMLIGQLRELEDQRERYTDAAFASEKARLENLAAAAMKERDRITGKKTVLEPRLTPLPQRTAQESEPKTGGPVSDAPSDRPAPATATSPTGEETTGLLANRPELRGFAWGVGTVVVAAGLFFWVTDQAKERPEGGSLTGGESAMGAGPMRGNGGEQTSQEILALRAHLDERPNDVTALARLAHLILAGDSDEARALTDRALAIDSGHLESRVHLGALMASAGQQKAGLQVIEEVLKASPTFAEAWLYHGMIAMRAGDLETGRSSLQRYVDTAPPGEEREHIVAILSGRAPATGPGEEPPHGAVGGSPMAAGPMAGRPMGGAAPFADLQARLQKNPDDLEAALKLSHLLLRQQRLEEAAPLVQKSLALAPEDPEARTHAALIRQASGDPAGGLKLLDAVVAEHPDFAEAWFFRGMIGMQSGDIEMSQASWRKFVEVAPEGPQKERIKGFLAGEGLKMGP